MEKVSIKMEMHNDLFDTIAIYKGETPALAQNAKGGRESHPSIVFLEEGCPSLGEKQQGPKAAAPLYPIPGILLTSI